MEIILKAIAKADREGLEKLMKAAIHRWRELHPDWELVWLTLPKYDQKERKENLKQICKILLQTDYKKTKQRKGDENV